MSHVFEIRGFVKCYEWGKLGSESSVAKLYKSFVPDFHIQKETPYAELWMGTHNMGPALIPSMDNIGLSQWIKEHPNSIGVHIKDCSRSDGLPFLFKVLSVNKSLSIQIHPDLPTAKILHERNSDLYPDDNHKPELAIALTNFQALCGFRPISEIKAFVFELVDFGAVIGRELSAEFLDADESSDQVLKKVFRKVITSPEEVYKPRLNKLIYEFNTNMSLSDLCKSVKDVFLTVSEEYPGDIGCFCVFFFNLMNLSPGEAIFLAANKPHAYLKGDCIECMACSDNVIRAGLTPKYRDVELLCKMISYECKPASDNLFPGVVNSADPHLVLYDPPVPEFSVAKIGLEQSAAHYPLSVIESASIAIITEGEGSAHLEENSTQTIPLRPGSTLFISSLAVVHLEVKSRKLTLYRAYSS